MDTSGEEQNITYPGPLNLSHIADNVYDLCPLSDPDVNLSVLVCDVQHTSFHFGLCGRKFAVCLFGQCPCLCTISHTLQHTGGVNLSLQADGMHALKIYRCWRMPPSLFIYLAVVLSEVCISSIQHFILAHC